MSITFSRLTDIANGLISDPFWHQWQSVESSLGIAFPADYKYLIQAGGSGVFGGVIQIFSPFASNDNLLSIHAQEASSRQKLLKTFAGGWCDMYPAMPGLLAVGGTEDGYRLMWQIDGCCERWGLHWVDSHMIPIEQSNHSLSSYLAGCMSGSLQPRVCELLGAELQNADFFQPIL